MLWDGTGSQLLTVDQGGCCKVWAMKVNNIACLKIKLFLGKSIALNLIKYSTFRCSLH